MADFFEDADTNIEDLGNFDFTLSSFDNFSPIEAGDYAAEVVSTNIERAKKGSVNLVVEFKIQKRKIKKWVTLLDAEGAQHPIGLSILTGYLKVLAPDLKTANPASIVATGLLIGKHCTVTLGVTDDEKYNEIKYISAYDASIDATEEATGF